MLYSCGLGLLHSCFVCFITYSNQPTSAVLISPCRATPGAPPGQEGHRCHHQAACTAEHLEAPVPSRPPAEVHQGRLRVKKHRQEVQERTLHKGLPPAIQDPTEDPLVLDLPAPCIQVSRGDHLISQRLKMLLQRREAVVVVGSTLPPQLRQHKARRRSTPSRLSAFRTHPINTNLV